MLTALEEHGLEQLDRNWAVLRREMRGEVHYRGASPVEIDLHWNLINMYRGRMRVRTGELLARAASVNLAGIEVETLDPTDSLIHLCVHAAISGGDRMIWLKDIERAVVIRPPAWDKLVSRANGWNVAGPVGLMLGRSRDFLDTPVPRRVIGDLVSRRARRLIRTVDRLSPWPRALGRLTSPNRLMARSIGQGLLGGSIGWWSGASGISTRARNRRIGLHAGRRRGRSRRLHRRGRGQRDRRDIAPRLIMGGV